MISDEYIGGQRTFLSLKWKSLIALSLVLTLVSASLGYLVFRKTTGQFETEQANKRLAQVRELNVVLSKGVESMSTFASFIPQLSTSENGYSPDHRTERISAVLVEHGVMLDVEWGVEGVHYFSGTQLSLPAVSWPEGRPVPLVENLLDLTRRDEAPRGRLVCDSRCYQIVALPLLQYGRTTGYLIIERSVADSLKEFHLLSGADIALLKSSEFRASSGSRYLSEWRRGVPGISHEDAFLPILHKFVERFEFDAILDRPRRVEFASEWYEIFAIPAAPSHPDLVLLVMNRVTEQVRAIRDATTDSLILGLTGLVLSELILLMLMWGPMQQIQDVVYALPLLAQKSFASLRDELPQFPTDSRPRDEIELMVNVIRAVSDQIEELDKARSLAEETLRDREQSLQLAQSMAKVGSWIGYPIEGVFTVSEGAGQIHPALEQVDTWEGFIGLVHPEDRSDLRIAWRRARIGSLLDVEFRLLIGETLIDLHVMAEFGLVEPGRFIRATGMMQDISEMRAVQRNLKRHRDRLENDVLERTAQLEAARNEAERLAQAKSEFLANMSHEIRTPLNAVLGFTQIGMRESRNHKTIATFEQIFEAGEHLLDVVNDVLDLSKLEAGKLSIGAQPFDLRGVVGKCVKLLEQQAEAKSLELRVRIADDIPERVVGDVIRIRQILINLLGNAIKFTEAGSVSISVHRDSDGFCFGVRDTGIGMSSEQIGRLFKPFQQIENSLTKSHEGTGLGLSISNMLAVLMGGDIQVSSGRGRGSEFVLQLPLKTLPGAEFERNTDDLAPAAGERRLTGIRVLVADDVSINRTIAKALLEAEGAVVTTVDNGSEAADAVLNRAEKGFDAVLMDLEMPRMNGRQAARRIRAMGKTVAIIGLTAHASEDERRASLASGMNDQLVKPVMQDSLVRMILHYLESV